MNDEDIVIPDTPIATNTGGAAPPGNATTPGDAATSGDAATPGGRSPSNEDVLANIQRSLTSLIAGFGALHSEVQELKERQAKEDSERANSSRLASTLSALTNITASASDSGHISQPGQGNGSPVPAPAAAWSQYVAPQKLTPLPMFSGGHEQWPIFVGAFRHSTESFRYSNLQNLIRLQKSLEGEAREVVRYLLIDPANVDELMSVLEFTYGRAEALVDDQLEVIKGLPEISERNILQIIPMASRVRNTIALLNTDASRHVLADTTLLKLLVSKLPLSKKEQWAEHSAQFTPRATCVEFSAWLTGRAKCLTALNLKPTQVTQPIQPKKHVLLNAASAPIPSIAACALCSMPHRLIECTEFGKLAVAERWAAARRLRACFGCLRPNHVFGVCRSKQKCQLNDCDRYHHEMLHDQQSTTFALNQPGPQPQSQSQRTTSTVTTSAAAQSPNVSQPNPFDGTSRQAEASAVYNCRDSPPVSPILFRVLPVTIVGPQKVVETYALLDEGSSFTAIDKELADELQLAGPESRLDMQFIGQNATSQMSREVEFQISGTGIHSRRFVVSHARTVCDLNLPIQSLSISANDPRYLHLRNLPIQQFSNAKPKVLIGLDNCKLGIGARTKTDQDSDIIATETPLGWVVYGQQSAPRSGESCYHCQTNPDERSMAETMVDFYSTENFGVQPIQAALESDDEIRARQILLSTTRRLRDRYETGLLWRSEAISLPDSREMALQRFGSLWRKMRKDKEYGDQYKQQIESYVSKGYARQLCTAEAEQHDARTWYLPHFGVRSASKPGKLRLVFDAAATVRGTSLNSALLKGPDLNQPLTRILFQFRIRPVGVCADVMEMFHQVNIRPEDRRAQRFMWKSADEAGPPQVFEMMVMIFGACCSPTSAQFVKNANANLYEGEFPDAAKSIREYHYVDDLVGSYSTEAEALRVTKEVVEVHKRGGFHLRGFVSNSDAVLDGLGAARDANHVVDLHFDSESSNKILGMRWHTQRDEFRFTTCFDKIPSDVRAGFRRPTKREVLSAAMTMFDPFGFLADFTLQAKLIMQALWRAGVAWDEIIPETLDSTWQSWFREVDKTRAFKMPRCYSQYITTAAEVQLHIFADASESAFAAVAYYRIECAGRREVAFVTGKARCAPLKLLTVPRLELQAAVLAARLYSNIMQCHEIQISKLVMWTDSQTVLQWVKSTQRRFKPFVAHRVAEILDHTNARDWRWIPTEQNVADDATRGQARPVFNPDSRWLRGPGFLLDDEEMWPTIPTAEAVETDGELPDEIRLRFVGMVVSGTTIDFCRFSSFIRLCRAAGYVLRFIFNARSVRDNRRTGELTAAEVEAGTKMVCILAQREAYSAEYGALQQNKKIDQSSSVRTLMPYMDSDGLLRLYGRTDAADGEYLPADAKRPILLPRRHYLSALLVQHHHQQTGHQLEDSVICAIRRRFWIPHLRVLVRQVKSRCQHCKIRSAKPIPPVAGQLPIDRLTPHVYPFQFTGLDYFGPVLVTIGRRQEKRWIALFTCLTTRAIHMEVAEDLSTGSCLMCIKNFANIRGVPQRIRSDCGKNFIGADNELRRTEDIFDMAAIQRELTTKNIEWLFNCPSNPEAGGVWERLVQSTKRVLAETLKSVAPRVETLRSLVIEAANILNSRPLTDIPVSSIELNPLTPNHFLLGRANSTTTPGPEEPKQLCNRRQWVVCQQLIRSFWRRWIRDYLPDLTRRTKAYKDVAPIKNGDLVLICEAGQSRGEWKRGRITRTFPGTDGRIRMAEVCVGASTLRRPVSKLAKLDVDGETLSGTSHGVRDVGERTAATTNM